MVTIRPTTLDDVDGIMRWVNDPAVRLKFACWEPVSREEELRFLEGLLASPEDKTYTICAGDGRYLGQVSLNKIYWPAKNARLSIAIVPESAASDENRFVLGTESSLEFIGDLNDKGELNTSNISPKDDGFHLKQIGTEIVVAGANPRGVLYGVYAFEDFVEEGRNDILDITRIPRFRSRILSVPYAFLSDHPSSYRTFSCRRR